MSAPELPEIPAFLRRERGSSAPRPPDPDSYAAQVREGRAAAATCRRAWARHAKRQARQRKAKARAKEEAARRARREREVSG